MSFENQQRQINCIVAVEAARKIDIHQIQQGLKRVIDLGLECLVNLNEGGDLSPTEEVARELNITEPIPICPAGYALECPADPDDGVMGLEPASIANFAERTRVVLTQWHVDEVVGDQDAYEYANRLVQRLEQYGLQIVPAGFVQGGEDATVDQA